VVANTIALTAAQTSSAAKQATMRDQVVELAERGKALSADDRSRLVDMLLESLNEQSLSEIESAWDEQAESRLAAYDRGDVQAIDDEEVLAKAKLLSRR
jgi:putative addiction module component (TIGR02574 family)